MRICENFNLTIGILTNIFVHVKQDRIRGLVGDIIDEHLGLNKKHLCRLSSSDFLGKHLPNKTWSGALGLLANKKAQFLFSPRLPNKMADFLRVSKTVNEKRVLIGQAFNLSPKDENTDAFLIFDFNFGMKIWFFSTFFVFFLFLLLSIKKMKNKNLFEFIKIILFTLIESKLALYNSKTLVGLLLILYSSYITFFKSMIINNIQSSKIIMDTSQIVKDPYELPFTKKQICWGDPNEALFAAKAPKKSILRTAYKKSLDENKKPIFCNFLKQNTHYIFLYREAYMNGMLLKQNTYLNENKAFFLATKALYRAPTIYYLRKEFYFSKIFKESINYFNEQEFECGLNFEFLKKIKNAFLDKTDIRSKIYQSTDRLAENYTKFNNLKMNYFKNTLIFLLVVNYIILYLFLMILAIKNKR